MEWGVGADVLRNARRRPPGFLPLEIATSLRSFFRMVKGGGGDFATGACSAQRLNVVLSAFLVCGYLVFGGLWHAEEILGPHPVGDHRICRAAIQPMGNPLCGRTFTSSGRRRVFRVVECVCQKRKYGDRKVEKRRSRFYRWCRYERFPPQVLLGHPNRSCTKPV